MQTEQSGVHRPIHPFHAMILAFPTVLFPSALLTDITYLNSAVIQWTNFSSWLIAGGCLFGAILLVIAAVGWVRLRRGPDAYWALLYLALIAALCLVGLINAFQHSRDGWSSVGIFGLLLSVLSTALALAASWVAHSGFNPWRRGA